MKTLSHAKFNHDRILSEVEIVPIKVALTHKQFVDLSLPTNNIEKKKKGSRYKKFVDKFGGVSAELEALKPEQLQTILRNAIDAVLDVDAFNREIDREKEDAVFLDEKRQRVLSAIGDVMEGRHG